MFDNKTLHFCQNSKASTAIILSYCSGFIDFIGGGQSAQTETANLKTDRPYQMQ